MITEKKLIAHSLTVYPVERCYSRADCDYVDLNYSERKAYIEGGLYVLDQLMKDAVDVGFGYNDDNAPTLFYTEEAWYKIRQITNQLRTGDKTKLVIFKEEKL